MEENHSEFYKIMLVEDEMIVAMDVQQRLESLGYVVVAHATCGQEALDYALTDKLDLILMDIKIRGSMDGISTAAKIREVLDIPIIYLTAFADDNTLKRARLTEAYGYLIKPFEDRELCSAIEMAIYKYRVEKKLRESEERYALAVRAANSGIWDWNLNNDQIYYSAYWANMLGLREDQISNSLSEWMNRIHPDDLCSVKNLLSAHLANNIPVFECEYRILHQDGGYRWMQCRGLAIFNVQQQPYRMAGSQIDITDRKLYEQQLVYKALHDELTGLYNRALFSDRVNMALEKNKRDNETRSAVIFLDLDHFKNVNDSFGHGWGDEILIQVARRLEGCLRSGDTIARFGGDEFAILLESLDDTQIALQILNRIMDKFLESFQICDREIYITGSVGFLPIDSSYLTPEEVLRDVDTAMYSAKTKGRARYEVFSQDMRERMLKRLDGVIEIRSAIKNCEFMLFYQPIFALPEQKLVGFEALIRWQHPIKGLIFPADFIPLAEETKLIIPIGEWVLRAACAQAKLWNAHYGNNLKITVNVSRYQLWADDFISSVEMVLQESGLEPRLLELEITESIAMENVEITLQRLQLLKKMGIRIAIDDFGSGHSSMDHLKRFPAHTLKIDQSFIEEIKEDDRVILKAMIQMAHQLHLITIAEGVENESQLAELQNLGCDQVQGFLLGKPLHPDSQQNLILRTQ